MGNYKVATHNTMLSEILALQISIPFRWGISLPRWERSLHIMIEKVKDIKDITQMRIIQLMEADYNAALKIIMRRTINNAIQKNIISHDLHGGLPKRSTHDALLSQQIIIDITNQSNQSGTLLNVDASKCFDRIYGNMENISLQRIGLHELTGNTISTATKNTQHHVRTSYGDSNNYFQSPDNNIWSGVGKGNAAAGPRWLAQ